VPLPLGKSPVSGSDGELFASDLADGAAGEGRGPLWVSSLKVVRMWTWGRLGRCRSVEARRGRTNFAFISMVFHGAGLNGFCVKPVVLVVAMQAEIVVQARS